MNQKVIIQEDETGCGIASVANIVGKSYTEVENEAHSLGIFTHDIKLYSDTQYVKTLLDHFGYQTQKNKESFISFSKLPNIALLAIKYRKENKVSFWHWVVFKRIKQKEYILDSASYLEKNLIEDFKHIKPKWFIEVHEGKKY